MIIELNILGELSLQMSSISISRPQVNVDVRSVAIVTKVLLT